MKNLNVNSQDVLEIKTVCQRNKMEARRKTKCLRRHVHLNCFLVLMYPIISSNIAELLGSSLYNKPMWQQQPIAFWSQQLE